MQLQNNESTCDFLQKRRHKVVFNTYNEKMHHHKVHNSMNTLSNTQPKILEFVWNLVFLASLPDYDVIRGQECPFFS